MSQTSSAKHRASSRSSADVIVAGGGGMGSAVAYFLKAWGPKNLRVIVCEQDPSYVRAATSLAAGGIRQQFSTPENILMSQFGFEFMRHCDDELASRPACGSQSGVGLRRVPYLHLAAGHDRVAELRRSFELQGKLGCTPVWLDRQAIASRYPWLNVADVDAAILGGSEEGVFDPHALLQALKRKAISLGAEYRTARISALRKDERGRISSVQLSDGDKLGCGVFVNAAGSQAREVASLAGIALPVIPVRAHTFVFRAEKAPPIDGFPIVMDSILGLNFRAEGNQFIAGSPREGGLEDAGDNFDIDYGLFDALLWPLLASRVQAFEAIRMTGAWVGHIEWSAMDANPIIGPHPKSPNFYFINGFSGHGAQHCPAAGQAIAELILYGAYRSIDLSRLGYDRILTRRPLRERY